MIPLETERNKERQRGDNLSNKQTNQKKNIYNFTSHLGWLLLGFDIEIQRNKERREESKRYRDGKTARQRNEGRDRPSHNAATSREIKRERQREHREREK